MGSGLQITVWRSMSNVRGLTKEGQNCLMFDVSKNKFFHNICIM
jgi:hypothetical protein